MFVPAADPLFCSAKKVGQKRRPLRWRSVLRADCTRRQELKREASETRCAQTADASLSVSVPGDASPSNGDSRQRQRPLQRQLQLQRSLRGQRQLQRQRQQQLSLRGASRTTALLCHQSRLANCVLHRRLSSNVSRQNQSCIRERRFLKAWLQPTGRRPSQNQ